MRAAAFLLAVFIGSLAAHAQSALPPATGSQVNLTCTAPAISADPVAGYIALRAPSGSTSFAQLNSTAVATCAYADNTVASLTTYNYAMESVDAQGHASVPSNMATVSVPASLPAAMVSGKTT